MGWLQFPSVSEAQVQRILGKLRSQQGSRSPSQEILETMEELVVATPCVPRHLRHGIYEELRHLTKDGRYLDTLIQAHPWQDFTEPPEPLR